MTPTSPGRDLGARVGVADPGLDAGEWEPDRAGPSFTVVRVGADHAGLGHAVALEDPLARAGLELGVRRRQEGSAAGHEQAHVLDEFTGEARMREEARVEGRHAHERGGRREETHDLVGVEARDEDHRSARDEGDVHRDEEAVGVEDREGVQEHVVLGELPCLRRAIGRCSGGSRG